jgi:hypothetical protein
MPDVTGSAASLVVFGHAFFALVLSWVYFQRYQVRRPALGVLDLGDVGFMLVGIVLVPLLYVWLPVGVVAALLGLGTLSLVSFTLEPVLRRGWLIWIAIVALLTADLVGSIWFGASDPRTFAINNLVLVLIVVGGANLWAQSGFRARDAALLGAALTAYDLIATAILPLMSQLFVRLAGQPFAPLLAWSIGDGLWLAFGLGDLLIAAAFPLVLRKAFGAMAGRVALGLATSTFAVLLAFPRVGTFPVMVVLGPLMVLQYTYWRRRHGHERTLGQFLHADAHKASGAFQA